MGLLKRDGVDSRRSAIGAPVTEAPESSCVGPYGPADHVKRVAAAHIAAMYMIRSGVDISRHFGAHRQIDQYRCRETGMLFWRPESVAGNEEFYQELSSGGAEYYRAWRWEYDLLDRYLTPDVRLLEVGCGRGFFLERAQGRVRGAMGIEFNRQAIADKVTSWPIEDVMVEEVARNRPASFDVVCAFHVLEHVTAPDAFIRGCLDCLRLGGRLILSVPNHQNVTHLNGLDVFDFPPHHINQFTPDAISKIARLHGVTSERLEVQPRSFELEAVTPATSRQIGYRIAARLARSVFPRLYRATREPGHTLLAVLRKPD